MASSTKTNNSGVILLVFVCYLVYNYNKKCVTFQYTHLIRQFGLSQQNAGSISSSQQFSISVVTFFGGILSDYVPSTLLFPLGLISCGLTTLLFPLGSSTTSFAFVWFLNGIGHGLALPTAMRLTKELSSDTTFATNWSFVLAAVNIAGVLNPMVSTFISNTFNWTVAIYLSGLVTLATGLVALFLFNQSNHNSIVIKDSKAKSTSHLRLTDLFVFPVLWILVGNRFVVALHRLSTSDWTQMYFTDEKNLPEYLGSLYVTAFEFSSVFGKLMSGRINDYIMGKYLPRLKSPLAIRLPISMIFHCMNVLSMVLYCNFINSSSSSFFLLSVAVLSGLFSSGNIITLSVLSTEISTKQHQGLVTSIVNLSVKVGGFCSGYPFTLLAFWTDWYTSYSIILLLTVFTVIVDFIFYRRSSKYKIE